MNNGGFKLKFKKRSQGRYFNSDDIFEALQFKGQNIDECKMFGNSDKPSVWFKPGAGLIVKNIGGEFLIEQNDWIIKLAENNLQRCKDSLFNKIYEPATESSQMNE